MQITDDIGWQMTGLYTVRILSEEYRHVAGAQALILMFSDVGSGQTALSSAAELLDLIPGMWWTGLIMSGLR